MRTLLKFLCLLAFAVGLSSCGNEDEEFENIDFMVTGIDLRDMTVNNHTHVGTLLPEGGTITFKAKGKNEDSGFVSEVSCGNYLWNRSQLQDVQYPQTICNEDWGQVTINSVLPHTTKIVVTPNTTGSTREIRVTFGGAYKMSIVYLKQPSM
ncbi:MAG: hypothetical protein ACOYJK_02205 [Prevotella sp.]|jgi:hypothetical protein